jgi:hypothetical protein
VPAAAVTAPPRHTSEGEQQIMSVDTQPETNQLGVRLWDQWTALWNGELSIGERILTADFRIHFGNDSSADTDSFRGPDDLTAFIGKFREQYQHLRYRTDVGPIVGVPLSAGTPADHVVCRWAADLTREDGTSASKAGIDILRIAEDRIAEVWSITGNRDLAAGS